VISSQDVRGAQEALGARLRAFRQAAGHSQYDFAKLAFTSRSSIANIETGRQNGDREFWQRCDALTHADGALLSAYDDLGDLVRRRMRQRAVAPSAADTYGGDVAPIVVTSPSHLDEILQHLREQWHSLVRTDNLLGPRFALNGVLAQLEILEALRSIVRDDGRTDVVRVSAQYGESAAWLYEEADRPFHARRWTSQAMEWAYEAQDRGMLAWTLYRRSQQALADGKAVEAVGLAQAARRDDDGLAPPTRAALCVQEAVSHAHDGDEQTSQRLLDSAHEWAANDTVGDAREGPGSFCTTAYIELQRAASWLTLGRPRAAISTFEKALPGLPGVYQRDRATALGRMATAYATDGQVELASQTALEGLALARAAGSRRTVREMKDVGSLVERHRPLSLVADLLDELARDEQ
jgi:DNA-binding XRE family transcriptional regulator